jgi:DNA-directed RNA polymerase subunit RPC12/RpoP
MRIIKSGEIVYYCSKCKSEIGMFPHEIHTYSAGYDDYDNDDVGRSYWNCPVCKAHNWIGNKKDYDEY